jgi:membrane associated rhomboid family serine protease
VLPIPLSDDNPTATRPVVTFGIIGINALAWLYELKHGVVESILDYGLIPRWLLHQASAGQLAVGPETMVQLTQEVPWPLTALTAMFIHGGWLHIIGNMWFLWIFGDNLEDRMGGVRYLFFYLLCGLAAAVTQVLSMPGSTAPMVGASGAIAGVMGGYLLLYPRAKIRCLWWVIIFITTVRIPAWIWLGVWFLYQFATPVGSGVAWMAHVGGFLAGLALVRLFVRAPDPPEPRQDIVWN